MKTTLPLLLLVAAASVQSFSLNQLLPDLPQKINALAGGDDTEGVNAAVHQTSFGASSFSSQSVPAAIAPNELQQPAFVRGGEVAISGALLTGQEKVTEVPGIIKQEKNSKPFSESFAKQFSNNNQPAYGAAIDTQRGGNQAPSFDVLPVERLGGNQQQTAFGVSSSSQFGGNQQTGVGAPSEDQFGGNQETSFGASSSSQFGGSQQSGIGVESGNKIGGSQTSFNPQSGGSQQGGLEASENTQFGGNQQTGFGAPSEDQFGGNQETSFGASSSSQFGGSQQSGIGVESGDQIGGSQTSFNPQSGGSQQGGLGASENTQFGGNQQTGGPQNAAAGSSGTYNVAFGDEYYIRTALPFAGYRPTMYTSLDLSQVDFQNELRSSGHEEYISVPDDDGDDAEVYRLVGVAPASALQGGAALTYSANIGATVPVYRELDDSYWTIPRASVYSAMAGSQQPVRVQAEATLAGGSFAVLLDD